MNDSVEAFESFRFGKAVLRVPLYVLRVDRLFTGRKQHFVAFGGERSLQSRAKQPAGTGDEHFHNYLLLPRRSCCTKFTIKLSSRSVNISRNGTMPFPPLAMW